MHIGLSLGISPIARLVGVESNPDDRVAGSERLKLATFEQMQFCKVEVRVSIGFIPGIGLCLFQILIAPLS